MGDRSGELIGDYQLMRLLDAGTFGAVYEAEQRYLKNRVALKVLTVKLEHEQVARFLEEARTIAALDHLSVSSLFITVELPDGSSFTATINADTGLKDISPSQGQTVMMAANRQQ